MTQPSQEWNDIALLTTGERIKYFRNKAGFTQKELAQKCQLSEPAIRNYELGNRTASLETLTDIAAALNINTYTLISSDISLLLKIIHTFFDMEKVYDLIPLAQDDTFSLTLDMEKYKDVPTSEIPITVNALNQWFKEWAACRKKLDENIISEKEYLEWQYTFPTPKKTGKK